MHTKSSLKNLKGTLGRPKHTSGDTKINLKETRCDGVELVQRAQDSGLHQPTVNTVMKLQVPSKWRISWTVERLLAFQQLSSMELVIKTTGKTNFIKNTHE
jgi:hypothetical protein